MSLSPELEAEYEAAFPPFLEGGGAIVGDHVRLKSWRYFLEINSACNLHCPTCTKGNKEGYDHLNGFMDMELMEKILDKIQSENPNAIVFTYGNSEPFLHPKLPECIRAIKSRGLHPEMSTNLNVLRRVDEVLEAGPDLIIISLSGFTQDTYILGHAGGDVEKVKANMRVIAEANDARKSERVNIAVNYHIYNDNQHEMELMKEYATSLGIGFFTSYARAISMENAIQYCRSKDDEATPFVVQEGRPDWNYVLPPIGETYVKAMDRLVIPPTKAREMYQQWPQLKACPIGHMFTFIRHDGKVSLCACVADRRIITGNYLELSQDERIMKRYDHSICQQCLKYRQSYYFHLVDRSQWVSPI
jgi:MoaA/NifB/PqqE/SkfB family radical SAM enzyme